MISQQPEMPWIRTKDKMPERDDWLLIHSKGSVPMTAIFEGDRWVTIEADKVVDEPDFWMPLPFVPVDML